MSLSICSFNSTINTSWIINTKLSQKIYLNKTIWANSLNVDYCLFCLNKHEIKFM